MSLSLGTMGGRVARLNPDLTELCAISLKVRDRWWENFVYRVRGTSCGTALEERRVVHIPDRVLELYRDEPNLKIFTNRAAATVAGERDRRKVVGKTGAAALLGTHPSTLSSRMRSPGIKRAARSERG